MVPSELALEARGVPGRRRRVRFRRHRRDQLLDGAPPQERAPQRSGATHRSPIRSPRRFDVECRSKDAVVRVRGAGERERREKCAPLLVDSVDGGCRRRGRASSGRGRRGARGPGCDHHNTQDAGEWGGWGGRAELVGRGVAARRGLSPAVWLDSRMRVRIPRTRSRPRARGGPGSVLECRSHSQPLTLLCALFAFAAQLVLRSKVVVVGTR